MYRISGCLFALMVAVAAGCSTSSGPKVEYVEGVVTLDGQPIEGVNVSFSPVDTKEGMGAVGKTNASGVFKLTSIPEGTPDGGAKAGEYFVTFTKVTSSDPNATMTSEDPNYGKEPASGKTEPAKIVREVPAIYENPTTSGFKVTVKPGKNSGADFKFDLKKGA